LSDQFNVVFTGLQTNATEEEFVKKFCQRFGVIEAKARKIAQSQTEVVIKKNIDETKARQYVIVLEAMGADIRLVDLQAEAESQKQQTVSASDVQDKKAAGLHLEPIEPATPPEQINGIICPKCGSDQVVDDECQSCGISVSRYIASLQEQISHKSEVHELEEEPTTENPYAPPEAELAYSRVQKDGQGSVEGAVNGEYDFTIGEIFSESWERTKGVKGTFFMAGVFYFLLAIAFNIIMTLISPEQELLMTQTSIGTLLFWSFIPVIISFPIIYPVFGGITLMGIHRAVDADINAGSIFNHYGKALSITLLMIVMMILIWLGYLLLIIPGIYLTVGYMMALALMMDKNMGVWEALETSRKAITRHWFKIFFIYLLLALLIMVAAIPLLIGWIWVMPMAVIMQGVMFKYMFGVDSV
jgi:hypothetical protein